MRIAGLFMMVFGHHLGVYRFDVELISFAYLSDGIIADHLGCLLPHNNIVLPGLGIIDQCLYLVLNYRYRHENYDLTLAG